MRAAPILALPNEALMSAMIRRLPDTWSIGSPPAKWWSGRQRGQVVENAVDAGAKRIDVVARRRTCADFGHRRRPRHGGGPDLAVERTHLETAGRGLLAFAAWDFVARPCRRLARSAA